MMITAVATIPTQNGSRYLQQLCKHWSHKFEVVFDTNNGTIPLPMGTATLAATNTELEVKVETADSATLERLQKVVAEHLDRFAFREAPLSFDWHPIDSSARSSGKSTIVY